MSAGWGAWLFRADPYQGAGPLHPGSRPLTHTPSLVCLLCVRLAGEVSEALVEGQEAGPKAGQESTEVPWKQDGG